MLDISREEFVEKANEISLSESYKQAIELGMEPSEEYKNHRPWSYYYASKEEKSEAKKYLSNFLIQTIYLGGIGGGSCWDEGESHHYYSSSGEKREFTYLDELLTKAVPDISFLKYKDISELVKEDERSESEYYGNTSDYLTYSINLSDLYDYLSE
jgi:hypothetical protein